MMSILLGALTGGAVFFVWSAISWMALPWQRAVYKPFTDEEAIAQVIGTHAPESGMYGLPAEPKYPPAATKEQRAAIDQAAWDKIQKGPTVTAVVKYGGFAPLPQMLAVALVTYCIVAGLFGWMLSHTSGLSYVERVGFVTVAGLAAGIICRVPDWNWHQYPLNHMLVQIANLAIGWLLAGLALAYFVRGTSS